MTSPFDGWPPAGLVVSLMIPTDTVHSDDVAHTTEDPETQTATQVLDITLVMIAQSPDHLALKPGRPRNKITAFSCRHCGIKPIYLNVKNGFRHCSCRGFVVYPIKSLIKLNVETDAQ